MDWDNQPGSKPLERVMIGGVVLKSGDQVRLKPKRHADALDLLLAGRMATIEAIEQDFENHIYLAVTIDDDPGQDLGFLRQPGHRFFYSVDEVEPAPKDSPPDQARR